MKRNVKRRRFELEALEPRLLLSADPLLVAGAMSAGANVPGAIEESYLPESIPTGLTYDAVTLVGDIFAGVAREDLASTPEPAAAEAVAAITAVAQDIPPVTAQLLSEPPEGGTPNLLAQDVSSVTEQLTETLHVANAPPEPSPQISQNTLAVTNQSEVGVSSSNAADQPTVGRSVEPNQSIPQVIYLSFDGEKDVTYRGPITLIGVDVPAFRAPLPFKGQEKALTDIILTALREVFHETSISFTVERPEAGSSYSTVYIGGDGSAFEPFGTFVGVSEKVDVGNMDPTDMAFVFSELLDPLSPLGTSYLNALVEVAAHEIGHLVGFEHAYEHHPSAGPLAEVAFKPYTHVEIAKDVLADIRDDGKLAINGQAYNLPPEVLAVLTAQVNGKYTYDPFFFAGVVGPDAFPDVVMGQGVIHPQDTGRWLAHILDSAWDAQSDPSYIPEERAQILAWSYGFLIHAAGDLWAHTLVNEFTGGPFPDFSDVVTEQVKTENAIRHIIIEGYIGDATPGFDGNPNRATLPDGDVSDDSTPEIEFDAPQRFIYETLIDPDADTPLPTRGQVIDGFLLLRKVLTVALKVFPDNGSGFIVGNYLGYYLNIWKQKIDDGLMHWSELGLAFARAFNDPQARRDLQNEFGPQKGTGSETDPLRVQFENAVSVIDVFEDETRDFVNDYLLEMLGLPEALGFARGYLQDLKEYVEFKIDQLHFLNPLRYGVNEVKNFARGILFDLVEQKFGMDIELLQDVLDSPSSKLGLASLNVLGRQFNLFKDGDQARLAGLLGLDLVTDHLPVDAGGVGTFRYHEAGTGANTSTWSFNGLVVGKTYRVFATWKYGPDQATNAPFKIFDGNTLLATVSADQTESPKQNLNDAQFAGIEWKNLGNFTVNNVLMFNNVQLRIELSDNANGRVIADAIRIEEVGALVPLPRLIDNGDDGYSESGTLWLSGSRGRGDVRYHGAGTGTGTEAASWTFDGLDASKTYEVFVKWKAASYNTTAAVYTVFNDTTMIGAATINQTLPADDETIGKFKWEKLGTVNTFTVTSGKLVIRLVQAASGSVIADAVLIRDAADPGAGVTIIENGDAGYTETGNFWLSEPDDILFGGIPGTDKAYHVGAIFYPGARGALTDAAVFNKATFAAYANSVTLSKLLLLDDFGLNQVLTTLVGMPYDVALWTRNSRYMNNIFTSTLPGVIGADGDFADARQWVRSIDFDHEWRTDSASTGPFRYHAAGSGATARWTFSGLQVGKSYDVFVTWEGGTNRATDAAFTLLDGATPETGTPVLFDQTLDPSDIRIAGRDWQRLGTTAFQADNGTFVVELNASGANGRVIADAVLIRETGNLFAVPTVIDNGDVRYTETGTGWANEAYPTGVGNFPLWESCLLRDDVFRVLFNDWQNGTQNFPDLGDVPSHDPNETGTEAWFFANTGTLIVTGNASHQVTIDVVGNPGQERVRVHWDEVVNASTAICADSHEVLKSLVRQIIVQGISAPNAIIAPALGSITTINSTLYPGEVRGIKWNDVSEDGLQGLDGSGNPEPVIAGWTVFVDLNYNGKLDELEPYRTTKADGTYAIPGLPAGLYRIVEESREDWLTSQPASGQFDTLVFANSGANALQSYNFPTSSTLNFATQLTNPGLVTPLWMTLGPDGKLYATLQSGVRRYNRFTGEFLDQFVTGSNFTGLNFGPDGQLYVSDSGGAIRKFNGQTGAALGVFATLPNSGSAEELLFGPDGALYVVDGSANAEVMRYNTTLSAFEEFTLKEEVAGHAMVQPKGLIFGPDGSLYVSSSGTDEILQFEACGDFFGVFANSVTVTQLDNPQGLAFGLDNDLYVVSQGTNSILRLNGPDKLLPGKLHSTTVNGLASPTELLFNRRTFRDSYIVHVTGLEQGLRFGNLDDFFPIDPEEFVGKLKSVSDALMKFNFGINALNYAQEYTEQFYNKLVAVNLAVTAPGLKFVATGTQNFSGGQLGRITSGDSVFSVQIGSDTPFTVTVPQSATSGNTSLADLATDFNDALVAYHLDDVLEAKIESGKLALAVKAGTNVSRLALFAAPDDPMIDEIGFEGAVAPVFSNLQEFFDRLGVIFDPDGPAGPQFFDVDPVYDFVHKKVSFNLNLLLGPAAAKIGTFFDIQGLKLEIKNLTYDRVAEEFSGEFTVAFASAMLFPNNDPDRFRVNLTAPCANVPAFRGTVEFLANDVTKIVLELRARMEFLQNDGTPLVTLDVVGQLRITDDGLAGRLGATLVSGPPAQLGIVLVSATSISVAINTSTTAAIDFNPAIPAGPLFLIKLTGLKITVDDFVEIDGNFGFKKQGPEIQVTASSVNAKFELPNVIALSATGGSLAMIIAGGKTVLQADLSVLTMTVGGGVPLAKLSSGAVTVTYNKGLTDYSGANALILNIDGVSAPLAAAPNTASFTVADLELKVADFLYVSGNLSFRKAADPVATLSDGATKDVELVTVGGDNVSIFAGFNGPLNTPGALGVSLTGVKFGLALAKPTLTSDTSSYYALHASATAGTLVGVSGVTLSVTSLHVLVNGDSDAQVSGRVINWTAGDLDQDGDTDGKTTVRAGPSSTQDIDLATKLLAVSGTADISVLSGAVTLGGNFSFEKASLDTNGDTVLEDVFKVGATGLHFELLAGPFSVVSFDQGSGAFIINSAGIAGMADLEFEVGVVGISGDIHLEVNTTNAAIVNTSVTIGATTKVIDYDLSETQFLQVCVDGYIHLNSVAVPFDFLVKMNTVSADVEFWSTTPDCVPIALLLSIDSSGAITLGPALSTLTNFDFAQAGPFEWVMMLRQLLTWIDAFRNSAAFDVKIPFTGGKTLGDAFDWSQLFLDKIYSKMTSVELQSRSLALETVDGNYNPVVTSGTLTDAKFKLQLGSGAPVEVTVNGSYTTAVNDLTSLVTAFNTAINATALTALQGRVVARIHKFKDQELGDPDYAIRYQDDVFVIALTDSEIAKGTQLKLVDLDAQIESLGFGPKDTIYGDANDTAAEQVGVATNRYDTKHFFEVLADILNDGLVNGNGGLTYNAAQQVYTYAVNEQFTYTTQDLFGMPSLPFHFDLDLGPIADASLSGALNFNATVGFAFTLGFDLGASEVPRILSSSLVPVPANGRLTEDAHFQIYLNEELPPIDLTLLKSNTTTNNSIEELAADLNTLFAGTTYSGLLTNGVATPLNQLLVAQKAGSGLAISALQEVDSDNNGVPDIDLNVDGNTDTWLGLINRIVITSAKNDIFATEMGFGIEVLDLDGFATTTGDQIFLSASNSTIKGLFIDDVHLEAALAVTTDVTAPDPNGIDGGLRFGYVDVTTTDGVFGTLAYDGTTPAPITATLNLQNQTTGETLFYTTELLHNTSSSNLANMAPEFDFTGSFLARLDNIAAGGLGFSFPMGSNPELSVWIPDITELDYNADPYNPAANNEGIFITYPSLGSLQNFTCLTFTQIIRGLNIIADSLTQLSAFSFLDDPLPFIDVSVNDMIDYATKFADLIDGASGAGSQSSLQATISELEHQIELLFDLDPSALTISIDENGMPAATMVTAGGVNGASNSSVTLNPGGDNNALLIRTTNNTAAAGYNGSVIRIIGDPSVTDTSAHASWDSTSKTLTILINSGMTTANAIKDAINAIQGAPTNSPWTAEIASVVDNGAGANLGTGTITTTALKFHFLFQTAYGNSLPFQLDLKKLVQQLDGTNPTVAAFLDAATTLVQIEGSGNLTVSASAALTLDFGLDLTNPCTVTPFFYDTTGVELLAKVLGTNIDIEASLGGAFGIFIHDGKVTLDADGDPDTDAGDGDRGASFRLGLKDNNGDGRHYFDENWFNSDSIDVHLDGGVSATLPIFAPFTGTPLDGDSDNNGDGYPDNYLVIEIPDIVRLFISEAVSTQTTGLSKIVKFAGKNNDLNIGSTLYTNYDVVFLDTLSGDGATATFDTPANTLTVKIEAGVTTGITARNAIQGVNGFTATALAATDSGTTNDGGGKLDKLTVITPDFSTLFDNLDFCTIISANIGKILDGLDKLLGSIQDGLNEIVYNTNLPLIGKGLRGAANFIDDFRNGLLKSLRDEVTAAAGDGVTAVENAIKKALWNTLGPGGTLNLLVDYNTGAALDQSLGYSQLDVTLDCDTGLIVNVRLGKTVALLDTTQNPIDFQIGVPGFGLEVDGNVLLSIGFDLKFGFGFNADDGFYFNTSAPAADPELVIDFKAEIPGLHAAGTLLFLQLDVMDDADDPTIFAGFFNVDLMDPDDDGKLTFAELMSSGTQFDDIIHAELGAVADVNLDLAASFGGNTAFPRVVAEFHLDWEFSLANGAGKPQIAITNIALDLGTFISDFLGPLLKEIRKITEPLQPIVDLVTARLPVISDLAGETITLLKLAGIFGLLEPSTVEFIEDVVGIVKLINQLDGIGEGSILIPFGSFGLSEDANGEMKNIGVLEQEAKKDVAKLQSAIDGADDPGASSTYKNKTSGFVGDVGSLSNFSIPIFDNPAELFNLFTGEPVRLVEWRMPTFKFEFTYIQKIAIYPPLYAQFGGSIGAEINVGFGYDTFGIQKYIASENKKVVDILDGFYVIDFDAGGNERAELVLTGEIFAGASIDLLVAEVGVRGGITATIEFDLNDVNDDGKVRVSEIIANAQQDPRCIFDIHGEIGLFLEAFLNVDLFFLSIEKEWRFAKITLFEFDITCPEPVLANFSGTDLLLNIGGRASHREEIDTNDNAERFIVKHIGGTAGDETVEVQWGNFNQTFKNVGRVVAQDAGQGDDTIDLRGVLSPSEVNGGDGDDTIYLSDGAGSTADGKAGNDTITASSKSSATGVKIWGGSGNDVLTAGATAIFIDGGDGNDTIAGSPEADGDADLTLLGLFGAGGQDTITGGKGDDYIDGGEGNDMIEGGAGNDFILGGGGTDTLRGSRDNDVIDGGDGDDQIYGGAGNDLLIGGNGSDKLYGHGGFDLLVGDSLDSGVGKVNNLALGYANRTGLLAAVAAIPISGITVKGLTGTGGDFLVGGGNVDALFGGDGNDFLYGGNFLAMGETEVIEEDGNDFFDGGRGNDTIFGDDSMGQTGDRNTGIAIKSGVWLDANLNGTRDSDETGFAGVTVSLYTASNPPGIGAAIATETTDVDGAFAFVGLDPNNYIIVFSLPSGLAFTMPPPPMTPVESAADDSDADPANPTLGQTGIFNVTYEETEANVSAGYFDTQPTVSVTDQSVNEGSGGETLINFTLTLSYRQADPVEIEYYTLDGYMSATAASGDYEPVTNTVLTFSPGETTKVISLVVYGDSMYEPHEQFQLNIVRAERIGAGGTVALTVTDSQILATIINDDPIPTISIQDFMQTGVDEDDDPMTPAIFIENMAATFLVTLSNPSQYPITVQWRTDVALTFQGANTDHAATPDGFSGADFLMNYGTLTFLPGVTNRTLTVVVNDDELDENEEEFFVDLFSPTYATIADNRAYGIISDDDAPVSVFIVPETPVSLPAVPQSFTTEVAEGDSGVTTANFWVTLSKASGKVITVTWNTAPGTAAEFVYSLGTDIVDYASTPNDGTPDEMRTLVFNPGDPLTKLITVQVYGDTKDEGSIDLDNGSQRIETFFVNLLSAVGADIASDSATRSNHGTVKIIDDDDTVGADAGPWSIYFDSPAYTVREPMFGAATVDVTLRRTPSSSNAVAVFYTTSGTATAGSDYVAVFRQLVYFAANERTKAIQIIIYNDSLVEGNETVILSLRNPTGGPVRASPDTATLTIQDGNTPELVFSVTSPSFTEGNSSGTSLVTIDVKLRDAVTHADLLAANQTSTITVNYKITEMTARANTDLFFDPSPRILPTDALKTETITFSPGLVTNSINVKIVKDTVPELTESFAVQLSSPVGATIGASNEATIVTIVDDDRTAISGVVFYDANGNRFKDLGEKGIKNVSVKVTYLNAGVATSVMFTTNASGIYQSTPSDDTTKVLLGQLSLDVNGATVTSPYNGFVTSGSGSYSTTTDNETQSVDYLGSVGLPAFADVGYQITHTFALPSGETTNDVGRGGTDDVIFGGPGDDRIDAGAGDDHVVGGHWMTATDENAPINDDDGVDGAAKYNAVVSAITSGLHAVYNNGPIFGIDTASADAGINAGGSISGQIWNDLDNDNQQDDGELFMLEVMVNLYDCDGNPINSVVTTTGAYTFTGLYLKADGSDSDYVVEFVLPSDYTFVSFVEKPETMDQDVIVGGRTDMITINNAAPAATEQDAGIKVNVALPFAPVGFEFGDPSYSVAESVTSGILTITVVRGNSLQGGAVLFGTADGTAHNGVDGNYMTVAATLDFAVGETIKTVDIPILNTGLLAGCTTPLTFTVNLLVRVANAAGFGLVPFHSAVVYIGGEGFGSITDDDTIQGGENWDILLGDSGNIPATTVIALPATLAAIVYSGGPGKDIINGGGGPDFIDGQLFDDVLSGDSGQDQIKAGLGNDLIYVNLDDDVIDGGHGTDTVFSTRDVAIIELTGNGTAATLVHRTSGGSPLSTFSLANVEVARLFGGFQDNTFNIAAWNGSADVYGAGGNDTLLVVNDALQMSLKNATTTEGQLFKTLHGFVKDSALSLLTGSTYHLGALEKVVLTGGSSNNFMNASAYSRPVTFIGGAGDDTLIGGAGDDTFMFAADSALGTDTITGNGGADRLDFTLTTAGITVDLAIYSSQTVVVSGNLKLELMDNLENVIGGAGNDHLYGNALNNVLQGGPGDDWLEGRAGSETYGFDTDSPWGNETIVESTSHSGHDVIDFSSTTSLPITLDLAILGSFQAVNANLNLQINGDGIEELRGGAFGDHLYGNALNNVLRGGPGKDWLDGRSGDDVLDGGTGNDDLDGGSGTDTINETANTNFTLTNTSLTRGTGEVDTLANIEVANLNGGVSANTFTLTSWSGGGALNGTGGNDTLVWAANANFTLTNLNLDDVRLTLFPGGTLDLIQIEQAMLTGGANNNILDASALTRNSDGVPRIQLTLNGGDGDDVLIGGPGADMLAGGPGDDALTGNDGNDRIDGGTGNDQLVENLSAPDWAADVVVHSGTLLIVRHDPTPTPPDETTGGYDILIGIETVDLTGSHSADTFDVSGWTTGTLTIDGGAIADDTVIVRVPAPGLSPPAGGTVTLTDSSVTFTGGSGTISLSFIELATLIGSSRNDTLDASGFTGKATLYGLGGNDTLIGGAGDDTLVGGAGDDNYQFDVDNALGADTIQEAVIGGVDTLNFSATQTVNVTVNLSLPAQQTVDPVTFNLKLTLGSTVNIENIIGGSGADVLTGNSLSNTFTGGLGADTISGVPGAPGTFDTIVETRDAGMMTLASTPAFSNLATLTIGGEVDSLTNIQRATLTGGASVNTLNAAGFTAGPVTLDGGGGNDFLTGGWGDDVLIGGAGGDQLEGGIGNDRFVFVQDGTPDQDTVEGGDGVDTLDFSAFTSDLSVDLSVVFFTQTVLLNDLELTLVGVDMENIIGGSGADELTGNSLSNTFTGGLGADQIVGGGGIDTIEESRDANFILTDTSVSIGGEVDSLTGIKRATLTGGAGNNMLDASAFTAGPVTLTGGDGNDTLIGGYGDDALNGGNGNDTLYGGAGVDMLLGGAGEDRLTGSGDNDTLEGGTGNDTYVFDQSFPQGNDTVIERLGEGAHDTLMGVGLSGIAVNLQITTAQFISGNLTLTLVYPTMPADSDQVEHSFS